MKDINEHFQKLETAMLDIYHDKDTGSKEELYDRFFSCMGIAYFVGCKMAEGIEEVCGRDVLINCMPNPPEEFFLLYNDAAKRKGAYTFNERTIEYLNSRKRSTNYIGDCRAFSVPAKLLKMLRG